MAQKRMQRRHGFEVSTLWSDDSLRVVDELEEDAPRGIDTGLSTGSGRSGGEQLANAVCGRFRECIPVSASVAKPRGKYPLWAW